MPGLDLLIDDLRRLVEVESPSHDVAALTASAEALAALILERTGRPAVLVDGPDGPHVHWSGGGAPGVLLLGHHDTVFPLGTLAARPFAVTAENEARRAIGPGVFDMKAGIVQAIHAVAGLPAELAAQVEMLFTADEEVGATTSRELLEARALACGNVLVLEPSADGGALKTARKGGGTFEVVVRGRAAHAGLEPENGRNALVEAAHQVLAINRLGAPELGTTVTPTLAHAGTAENVVPAEARVRVDVRVAELAEGHRVEQAMSRLAPVTPDVTIEVLGRVGRPAMPPAASAPLFPLAEAAQPGIGGVAVGGMSDGNFTAALGVPTLDGLGAVGGGAHADHEWVDVDTMPARVGLLAGILRGLLT
ncbi:MAG TPA: M20 family metallopeptidase [Ilumatobacter sp.]|nr:M20 family metallopeptidase [Ilumatobacter sp.]